MSLQPSFKIPVKDDETRVYVMAKPLIIDPNGEGSPVLVAATGTGEFGVYDTYYTKGNLEGLFVTMNPRKSVHTYGRVLAFGAGSIEHNASATILAVLTDDYKLRTFSSRSHYSELLWEVEVVPPESWHIVMHAAISVVPERVYEEDKGMVAIAVKVVSVDEVELTLFAAYDGGTGNRRWQFLSDSMNELNSVVNEANHKTPLNEVMDLFPVALHDDSKEVAGGGIHHQYKVPMVGRLYEKPWTTYREAVIAALPHHYNHPWDAQLRPHVIYPQKSTNAQRFRAGAKMTFLRNNRLLRMDQEDYGLLGQTLDFWNEGKADSRQPVLNTKNSPQNKAKRNKRRAASSFVYHGRLGIEILHMYTGNTITQVVPLKANDGSYYHDINDDFQIELIKTKIGPRILANGEHGVDLLYDCLGTIHTGVPLGEDEVVNATICDTEGFFGNLDLIHHFVDGDIRGEGAPHSLNMLELLGSTNRVTAATRSVPPVVVQVHRAIGRGVTQMERYAVFLIDSGLATCVDPSRRRVLWRTQTESSFSDLVETIKTRNYSGLARTSEEMESLVRPYPHLAPYSFYQRAPEDDPNHVSGGRSRYRRTDPYVIAVGERVMSAINTKNGRVVRHVKLPEPPIAPIIIADFNGDGVNDVIVVTRRHIYGFVGGAQVSTSTVTSLMVLMVALLVLLFVARELTFSKDEDEDEYLPPGATQEEILKHKPRVHKRATD